MFRRISWSAVLAALPFLLAQSDRMRAQDLQSVDAKAVATGVLLASSIPGVEEAYLPITSPASHSSNLLTLQNGDTLCFWFSGSKEAATGVAVVMSRLNRGSRQWSHPIIVASEPGQADQNPVPFQAPDGTIWVFHASQPGEKGETVAKVMLVKSTDNGKTWTAPKPVFTSPGVFTRQSFLLTSEGRWMLPVFYVLPGDARKTNFAAVEISDDHGLTWSECVVPKTTTGLVQPNVLQLAPHSFLMFLRSRHADWIYRSTSTDGCHWSDPVPTALPNNNASMRAILLKNGHLVMAFDNANASVPDGPALRFPLSIALSEDHGVTWKWVRDVEVASKSFTQANSEFSYPSVMQRPNGDIMVSYTYNRETIKIVEFQEDWIRHGTTIGKYHPPSNNAVASPR